MERTYLFVPPEEKAEVQALGARWDAASKRWYLEANAPSERFARWLPASGEDEEFIITSDQAYVAAAVTTCRECRSAIEVICIHCRSGAVSGEPLTHFTVSDVWTMDDGLTSQLRPWPNYRKAAGPDAEASSFANHCPHCGALQEDLYLHSEPGDPFFGIPRAAPGAIRLTPLAGTIRLSGDEHFGVE